MQPAPGSGIRLGRIAGGLLLELVDAVLQLLHVAAQLLDLLRRAI